MLAQLDLLASDPRTMVAIISGLEQEVSDPDDAD